MPFGEDRITKHLMFMKLKRSKWNWNVVAEKLAKTRDILRRKWISGFWFDIRKCDAVQ